MVALPPVRAASPPLPEATRVRRLRIDTGPEHVVFLRRESPACRSEGFAAHSRIELRRGERRILATVAIVDGEWLALDEAGLSDSAWECLGAEAADPVVLAHPANVDSLASVRAKIYGRVLDDTQLLGIVRDIVDERYSNIELSAFITACSDEHLDAEEVHGLTAAMVATGERLTWPQAVVVDKHCIGGLAGNRTTPIVVAIAAACGLTMPKTSSRAITSPAGTADTMATMAPVDLDPARMRAVVEQTGGCVVWGGAMKLAPADDVLIRVERALDIDSPGQLVASVLSKKIAAGATHVVIDIPVGPTAKVRDEAEAHTLSNLLQAVAARFGLHLRILLSDGTQPVGRGVGPALEAHDVLAVLQNRPDAPRDLRQHALRIAAAVLECGGATTPGHGLALAGDCLASGRAWTRFQAICEAQGGMRTPGTAAWTRPVPAPRAGRVAAIDNRRLSRVAKLAGAPSDALAGLTLDVHLGHWVSPGQSLFTVHAQTPGELAYAMEYISRHPGIVTLEPA